MPDSLAYGGVQTGGRLPMPLPPGYQWGSDRFTYRDEDQREQSSAANYIYGPSGEPQTIMGRQGPSSTPWDGSGFKLTDQSQARTPDSGLDQFMSNLPVLLGALLPTLGYSGVLSALQGGGLGAAGAGAAGGAMDMFGALNSPLGTGAPGVLGIDSFQQLLGGAGGAGGLNMPGNPMTQIAQVVKSLFGGGGAGGAGAAPGTPGGPNWSDMAGLVSGLWQLFGGEGVDPTKMNQLWSAGMDTYNMGRDPQNALRDRNQQRTVDASRAATSARGIGTSPAAAGIENDAVRNFNLDWENNALARAKTGFNALAEGTGGYFGQSNADRAFKTQQNTAGMNSALTGGSNFLNWLTGGAGSAPVSPGMTPGQEAFGGGGPSADPYYGFGDSGVYEGP